MIFKKIKYSIRLHVKKNKYCISPSKQKPITKLLWILENQYKTRRPVILQKESKNYNNIYIVFYKKNYVNIDQSFLIARRFEIEKKKNKIKILPIYIPYLILLFFILKC